jgi:3-dehydroquinate synthase
MSKTVHVDLKERGYDIQIDSDLPVGATLAGKPGTRALIISDSNVDKLYGEKCEQALRAHAIESTRAVVPAGEASKDLKVVNELYAKAMAGGLDRSSVIVALGGGVVGDLAGFVAATFLRGIRFIQVPTTLLAMVDSSVGGKTGVNLPQGKNLVGSFHQPIEVVADLSTLKTLSEREYVSGLAEVVKYGVIWDAVLFKQLEENAEQLLKCDPATLESVIGRCCEIKADVVAMDEREGGVRSILNFGHTLGHALERVAGYGGHLHGEAVAVGMVYAARLSRQSKKFPDEDFNRLVALLKRVGLPVSICDLNMKAEWKDVRAAMTSDKKTLMKTPRFVLAERIGAVVFGCEEPEGRLEQNWSEIQGV